MFDADAVKEAFGRAAHDYDAHAELQHEVRRQCITLAQTCWPDRLHILDAGCGTGSLLHDMQSLGLSWRVTGLDLAPGMCSAAQSHSSAVVNANAEIMPFGDGSFDGVFSSLMLQWINDPIKVLREMARVTKPRSRSIVSTFTHGTLQELRDSFATLDDTPHVSQFAEEHLLSAMAAHAGFIVLSVDKETITEHYPDSVTLMRSLQAIGATNKQESRRKGLMTPHQLGRLERIYRECFGDKFGLPVTWQVMYMVLEKH